MSTTALNLLTTLHTHLGGVTLPEIASIHLSATPWHPQVIVQLASHEPPTIAAGLLA